MVASRSETESDAEGSDGEPSSSSSSGVARVVAEWMFIIGGALLIAVVVRTFLFQAFSIPSESMEDTLLIGDHVVVEKLSYRFGSVDRGDIVVFDTPEGVWSEFDEMIKRVIGLPGDTIAARGGQVLVNDVPLDEPYLHPDAITMDFGPVTVPEGQVFLMGDNRHRSSDSRTFGAVDIDRIVGQARARYWPLSRLGGL